MNPQGSSEKTPVDVVDELRSIQALLPAELKVLHRAADEIEQLRIEVSVAHERINVLCGEVSEALVKLRRAEQRAWAIHDDGIRGLGTSSLRAELARRQRMEDMLADDELWDRPQRGEQ